MERNRAKRAFRNIDRICQGEARFVALHTLTLPLLFSGDYESVQRIVAHEYFHNWSGNRVTCRDWFQLTLKEGLTVFRDQHFSSDMRSSAVKRIEDVRIMRSAQFLQERSTHL